MKSALLLCLLASFAYAQTPHMDVGLPEPFGSCNTVILTTDSKDIFALVANALATESYIVLSSQDHRSIVAMGSSTQSPDVPLSITLSCLIGDSTVSLRGTYLPPVGHAGRLAPLVNRGAKGSYNIIAWTEAERLVGVLAQTLRATKVRYFVSKEDFE